MATPKRALDAALTVSSSCATRKAARCANSDDEEADDGSELDEEEEPFLPPPLPSESSVEAMGVSQLKEVLQEQRVPFNKSATKATLKLAVRDLLQSRRAATTDRILVGRLEWGRAADGSPCLIERPFAPFRSWCNACGDERLPDVRACASAARLPASRA